MGLRLLIFVLALGWTNSAIAMAVCSPEFTYESSVCEDEDADEKVDCDKDPASCQSCTYSKGAPKITNPRTGSCEQGKDGLWRAVGVTCSCAKAEKLKSTDPTPTCAECPRPADVDFSVPMSYPSNVSARTEEECNDWIITGSQDYNPGPGPCHRNWIVDDKGTTLRKACTDMTEKTIKIPCTKKATQVDADAF
jgi:hypothetical protein